MSQKTKYVVNNLFWTIITTVIAGALLQTFLLEKGITQVNVGRFASIMQFVQMAVILVFSAFADKIRDIIHFTAASHFLYLPFFVLLTVLSLTTSANFILLVILAIVAFVGSGLYNVLSYKLPYSIMDMTDYGKWTGTSAVVSSLFMFGLTTLLSIMQKRFGYFPTMRIFFPFACVCIILFIFTTNAYTPVHPPKTELKNKKISLLTYKPFTLLILPNLLRGFCAGMISMAVTLGYASNKLNADSSGILLIITQTVGIPANYVYTKLTHKEPLLILLFSSGIFATLCFLGVANTVVFLILYGIAYFCITIINVCVPVYVTQIVDYEVVGQYNGWRMMLNTAGSFLATLLAVPMVNAIGATFTWLLAGAFQLISGIAYFIYSKKKATFN